MTHNQEKPKPRVQHREPDIKIQTQKTGNKNKRQNFGKENNKSDYKLADYWRVEVEMSMSDR